MLDYYLVHAKVGHDMKSMLASKEMINDADRYAHPV